MNPLRAPHQAAARTCRASRGWALALLLLTAPITAAHGQPQGSGPSFAVSAQVPVQDDAARARARALLEAMNQALEQAVTQAAPEARGRLYLLAARARDYITTYRVLEEGESGGQFLLRLEAQVDLPRLLHDLQGTLPASRQASARRAALLLCACADRFYTLGFGSTIDTPLGRDSMGRDRVLAAHALGDLDRDGRLDVAAVTVNGEVNVLTSRGDGGFAVGVSYQTTVGGTYGVTTGDLNDDGLAEVVVSHIDQLRLSVFLNRGDALLEPPAAPIDLGCKPAAVVIDDVIAQLRTIDALLCGAVTPLAPTEAKP